MIARADAARLPLASKSVALTVGSPPYCDARTYGIGAQRDCRGWVRWMLGLTAECLRVTDGPVIWIAAGVTRDRTYWPACEGLMWRWFDEGWTEAGPGTATEGSAYRPCYWHRNGISGSGGDQWYRADVEYAMCFKREGSLPHGDPKANGLPPKWTPGGAMSHRDQHGARANKVRGTYRPGSKLITIGYADGRTEVQGYVPPDIANPGNMLHTNNGGGKLGHSLAHEGEAPFPVEVPAFFIRSHCPIAGTVLDPFSGSGTTGHAAKQEGRKFIGFDLRLSQCQLSRRRIATVTPSLPFGEIA